MYEQASRFPVSRVPVYYLARQLSPSVFRKLRHAESIGVAELFREEKATDRERRRPGRIRRYESNGDSRDGRPIEISVPTVGIHDGRWHVLPNRSVGPHAPK